MKKNLINKFTLKILSLVIAVLIWLMVVTIDEPVINGTFYGIPVVIKNESYLASDLKIPMLVEGKDTVDVRVRGPKSVIDKLKKENITAEADVQQIVSMDTTPCMVPVSVTCPGIDSEDIIISPGNIPLDIQPQASVDKVISASSGETVPDKNYEIGSIKAKPEKVTISGPESIVNKIDRIVARIDVSDKTESYTGSSELKIYDKNQEELSEKEKAYIDLKGINNNTVEVQVDLWRVKSNIQLKTSYSGNPRFGYEVSSVSLTPDTVSIAGTEEALQELEEQGNILEIPPSYISVTGKADDFEVGIDLSELLPQNTKLARNINSSVIATVKILPYNSREYTVSAANITTENKPDDLDVVYEQEKITVRVRGKESTLDDLTSEDIQLKIDLKDYKAGDYQMPVTVTLPSGCQLVDAIKVNVELVPKAE